MKWKNKGIKGEATEKKKAEMKMKIWGKEANKALRVKCTLLWNLEKAMAPHSKYSCLENPMDRGACALEKEYICDRKHKVEKFFHNMKDSGK